MTPSGMAHVFQLEPEDGPGDAGFCFGVRSEFHDRSFTNKKDQRL
jgi:hypothetical protein